jgi:GntR family transcriptional regulator, trigonelline degradation regulator
MGQTTETRTLPAKDALRVERNSQTLTQQVVEGLRNAIRSGRFEPGQRLVERRLCDMTGVSRTAVREALRSLETQGLVVNAPNRGPTVAAVALDEAIEIYEVREMLETRAVELFMKRMTGADLALLHEVMLAMENALAMNDVDAVNDEKQRFYNLIITGSGNRLIGRILDQLYGKIALLRNVTMNQDNRIGAAVSELRAMFDAINARDVKAARRACQRHVEAAASVACAALAERAKLA